MWSYTESYISNHNIFSKQILQKNILKALWFMLARNLKIDEKITW